MMVPADPPTEAPKRMYEIVCDSCGSIGIHPSRLGAEGRAERHVEETGHDCDVEVMDDV